MSNDMDMSGPTVTLFGDLDALGGAVSDELAYRGLSTHAVTTPMGWINSVEHAIVRLGTTVGERAFETLAAGGTPPSHVVAVCETSRDDAVTARREAQCRQAGRHHTVTLIWHPPLELRLGDIGPEIAPRELAVAIADEIAGMVGRAEPGFVERTLLPQAKNLS